ncbi:MAG: CpsB/CapC family capsule biosynthesis tyrosine phosphatase [Planctomycetales bacterium]
MAQPSDLKRPAEQKNSEQKIAPGKIDLHSHLVPGIDDGCATREDSLACVRQLMAQGFIGTVCTPHIIQDQFPDNTPARIAPLVAELQEYLIANGLNYRLWTGGEVRIAPGILNWFDSIGIPTLGSSRYVLLDWWERAWPDYGYGLFRDLLDANYQPILAHPERMGLPEQELFSLIADLREMGVLLQGNFNSISGGEGPQAAAWAKQWLEQGDYDLLATDMHRPESLPGRIKGILQAEAAIGRENFAQRMETRPRDILFRTDAQSHAA